VPVAVRLGCKPVTAAIALTAVVEFTLIGAVYFVELVVGVVPSVV
jgi:hypothetical protein